jgi:hypothetical protein
VLDLIRGHSWNGRAIWQQRWCRAYGYRQNANQVTRAKAAADSQAPAAKKAAMTLRLRRSLASADKVKARKVTAMATSNKVVVENIARGFPAIFCPDCARE